VAAEVAWTPMVCTLDGVLLGILAGGGNLAYAPTFLKCL